MFMNVGYYYLYNICLLRAFEHIHMEFARYKCFFIKIISLRKAQLETTCFIVLCILICFGRSLCCVVTCHINMID